MPQLPRESQRELAGVVGGQWVDSPPLSSDLLTHTEAFLAQVAFKIIIIIDYIIVSIYLVLDGVVGTTEPLFSLISTHFSLLPLTFPLALPAMDGGHIPT